MRFQNNYTFTAEYVDNHYIIVAVSTASQPLTLTYLFSCPLY